MNEDVTISTQQTKWTHKWENYSKVKITKNTMKQI